VDYASFKAMDEGELENEIKLLVEKNKSMSQGALMGLVMGKFKGQVDGKTVMGLLRKYQ